MATIGLWTELTRQAGVAVPHERLMAAVEGPPDRRPLLLKLLPCVLRVGAVQEGAVRRPILSPAGRG